MQNLQTDWSYQRPVFQVRTEWTFCPQSVQPHRPEDVNALIDTGSAVTVVPHRVFVRSGIEREMLVGATSKLTAFGHRQVPVMAECSGFLKIGADVYFTRLLVVEDSMARSEMLVGRDIISQGESYVNYHGVITLRITSHPILKYPDFNKHLKLTQMPVNLGAVLLLLYFWRGILYILITRH